MIDDVRALTDQAVARLRDTFGDDFGGWLIWNATCFPFDAYIAAAQAEDLIAAHASGGLRAVAKLVADLGAR